MEEWTGCKNILCIRPDNMGDLIMSAPAMRALKETFGCTITLLTSPMAADIVPFLPEIDDVIQWNAPWVKANEISDVESFYTVIDEVQSRRFDAAVILPCTAKTLCHQPCWLILPAFPKDWLTAARILTIY